MCVLPISTTLCTRRPGKRSLASGRINYRPGKRAAVAEYCQVDEIKERMNIMNQLYDELQVGI